jgi:NHLM bacteriocin system ABC transporter ATP-binding protein
MLAEGSSVNFFGEPYFFKSNDPLLLDDRDTIWFVQSGSLALFAINVQNGIPKGRRRYLFSVKAGEAMFCATLTSAAGQYQILAVALEATELLQVTKAEFCKSAGEDKTAIDRIERWVNHLGSAVSEINSPILPTPAKTPGCTVLGSLEVFQPSDKVVWVQILQGQANLLGFDELQLDSDIGRIPLERHLWLQAIAILEIDSIESKDIHNYNILLNGLHHLQTFVLQAIVQLEQQQTRAELVRTQERERLNNSAIANTINDFANIFDVQNSNSPVKQPLNSDEALLFAAGAVGKALDITIHPPAKSEDLRRVRDPQGAIARASRIRIRRITLRDEWWHQDSGPILAYTLADNRPVAVLPISDTRYEIIDPLQQTRVRCDKKTAATLSPQAYTFLRPLPVETRSFTDLLHFALRGQSKELLTILFAGIATTLLGMITPQATAILIDGAIPDADRSLLFQLGLGLLATTLGATLFQLTQAVAIVRLETFADTSTQAAVWDRLLKLKASFFRDYSIGDLSSRVSVISQIRSKLSNTLLKSFFSGVFSLLNLGLLFYYSVPLALIATFVAAINIAVTIISGILTLRKVRPLLNQQGLLFGMMVQIIGGVAKFRVAGAEARAFAYWGRQYRHQLHLMLGTQGIEDNMVVINNILAALTPAVIFAFATDLLQHSQADGGISTGTFLAFNAAFGTFISGATSLSSTVVDILEVLPLWERAQPILQATPEVDANKTDPGRLSGRVEIKHIVFRYRAHSDLTLDDVSLRVEPGEFIALVGSSGSGKSTLFRLLLGFDSPESGSIFYDGQELAGLDVNAVRRQLGVVLQNSRLMSASMFENMALHNRGMD